MNLICGSHRLKVEKRNNLCPTNYHEYADPHHGLLFYSRPYRTYGKLKPHTKTCPAIVIAQKFGALQG